MNKKPQETKGTLRELEFVLSVGTSKLILWQKMLANNDGGNARFYEILGGTLARVLEGKAVSDRYILGLAWFLRDRKESDEL